MLGSLATVALFKLAPYADDNAYLTRWIAMYMPSRDYWLKLNSEYTALQTKSSESTILVTSAHLPNKHNFSYPQYVPFRDLNGFLLRNKQGNDTSIELFKRSGHDRGHERRCTQVVEYGR